MRSETFWSLFCATTILAMVLASGVSGVQAQQSEAAQESQEETQGQPAEGAEAEGEGQAIPEVPEAIELVEGSGYTYDARGRRDPFISLALGLNILPPEVRPPGLGGMLIQEVSLRGIVKTSEGYIAMIQGTDNKSYFAREGERMYDGTIESIDSEKVVFRQEINDPLRIEKFQRLEKWLHPVEEGQ
jgi:hypothetical protein